ncbi:hypothetical protein LJE71_11305 [Xanthobacter autotrophicus]|uniref:Uncharacterized protein n=1 Tax=Xanthobacter dioxanivorans TaxID=2528964 RepID=A0A974PVF2_9HYPH|nr:MULTISPECIES: hypothetical protein [Xanthobacter]QRG10236.1 hypothetical protein EZH22_31175 [Xanthobacter dioxanivorans]UDQ91537.1 hypothetical protein LJE71_11305 [Xanthobacter autotrophicus]
MAIYTSKEDMHFAECCPITIYRDGRPILAVVGEGQPAEKATEVDRALAEEVRRALANAPKMLELLRVIRGLPDAMVALARAGHGEAFMAVMGDAPGCANSN